MNYISSDILVIKVHMHIESLQLTLNLRKNVDSLQPLLKHCNAAFSANRLFCAGVETIRLKVVSFG